MARRAESVDVVESDKLDSKTPRSFVSIDFPLLKDFNAQQLSRTGKENVFCSSILVSRYAL